MPIRTCAALCSLFLALSTQAQDAETPSGNEEADTLLWTPQASMRFHDVSDVAMSPNGRLVAYVVSEPKMEGEESEFRSHVWVASADGSSNVQYTRGEKSASNPAFTSDGEFLTFTTSRSEKNQVWMMRVRGGEAEQVTDAESGVNGYRWSPDGTRIAYTMSEPETEAEKKRKEEKRDVIVVDEDFDYSHLYVVNVEADENGDRAVQRLTGGAFHVTSFDWAPDGDAIVFAHQPDPRINTGFNQSDLSIVPADSGAVTPLVDWDGADRDPHFSPGGEWVAFESHGETPQEIGLTDVYVVPVEGGTPRKLADTPDRNANLLAWSADGSHVYVAEVEGTTRQVLALPADGGVPSRVTATEGVIGSVAFDDDAMAFTWQDTDTPEELYVSPVDHVDMRKLSSVNDDVPMPEMGPTRVVSWTSPDGTQVEGLLTYPVGYEEGRRYPLILNIHGGPAGVYTQSFTGDASIYQLQYFAQHGYAVLRPNPRGSTGYGRDFRFANVLDWGFGDYEDVMSGVDTVIDMGVGHPDSLAVMGWSYGGYLTSFVVTRTDRFQAASMGAGLPNLVSMVTTTDIPAYLVAHMGGNEFWEDVETYQKHSAMYRIDKVSTPTQVIHGAEDVRVPFSQGQEFYAALKRLGVRTEMIVLPRTPHGPQEPKLLMAVSPYILRWFEKHVRGREMEIDL